MKEILNDIMTSNQLESFLRGLGSNYLIQLMLIIIVFYTDPFKDKWLLDILTSDTSVEIYFLIYSCCSALYHYGIPNNKKDLISWTSTLLVTRGVSYKIMSGMNMGNLDKGGIKYYSNLFLTFTLKPMVNSVIQLEPVASRTRTKVSERIPHYMLNGNFYLGFGFMYTLVSTFLPDRGDLRLMIYLFNYIPLEYKKLNRKIRSLSRLNEFENIMPATC